MTGAERMAKWRLEHPDRWKQWAEKNRDALLIKYRAYNKTRNHKELYARRKDDPEFKRKAAERSRKWRAEHPGITSVQGRAWKEKNPEKYRLCYANKYANRKQGGAYKWKLTGEMLAAFMIEQNGSCYYCHTVLEQGYHVEHKTPLSKGGRHILENLCLSCRRCNLRKHDKTEHEFKIYLETPR